MRSRSASLAEDRIAPKSGWSVQQNYEATVFPLEVGEKAAMFRPDPNGLHSRQEVIAKLTEVLQELPSDSPRAERLVEMIRKLQEAITENIDSP